MKTEDKALEESATALTRLAEDLQLGGVLSLRLRGILETAPSPLAPDHAWTDSPPAFDNLAAFRVKPASEVPLEEIARLASIHHGANNPPEEWAWLFPEVAEEPEEGAKQLLGNHLEFLARSLDDAIRMRRSAVTLRTTLAQARDRWLQEQGRGGDLRRSGDELRQSLQETFSGLRDTLDATIRSKAHFEAVHRLAQQLDDQQLAEQRVPSGTALTIDSGFLGRIDTALQGPARAAIDGTITHIERVVNRLARVLSEALDVGMVGLLPSAIDRDRIWQELSGRLSVESNVNVVQPARGFMQRVAEGRRPLYVTLMMISLFGAPLGIRRGPEVAIAMGVLFVCGILFTFRSWRKQEAEQRVKLAAEARVRLKDSCARAEEEFLRTAQSSIGAHIADGMRQTQRRLDEALKVELEQHMKRAAEERESIRARVERDKLEFSDLDRKAEQLREVKLAMDKSRTRTA